ncbi:MAG TPA: hypothetical protein VLW50_05060 [Streptosporangiaceae bacterium]|nr:hypothetical protein [Streptosporangiaceae bacterium]
MAAPCTTTPRRAPRGVVVVAHMTSQALGQDKHRLAMHPAGRRSLSAGHARSPAARAR